MFSENDRRNIIVGTLVVIALTIACVGTASFYKSSVPEQVEGNTINITPAEYEQALAKWQARNVSEYDITLHSGQDDVILHVSGGEGSIEVLQHMHGGSPVTEELPGGTAVLRGMTVSQLFRRSAEGLATASGGARSTPDGKDIFRDYTFRFDPNLGYPTFYATYQRTTRPSREVVWRDTLQAPIEVRDLKVIR